MRLLAWPSSALAALSCCPAPTASSQHTPHDGVVGLFREPLHPPHAGRGEEAWAVCQGGLSAELSGGDLKDCASTHSLSSNTSLPSVHSCRRLRDRRVASWAVSFERLLQDPLGVQYFSVSGAPRGGGGGSQGRRQAG